MSSRTIFSFTLAFVLTLIIYTSPACAQSVLGAAAEVESSIQSSMSRAGTGSGPTLGQLGGVQAGSVGNDGGRGVGGEGRHYSVHQVEAPKKKTGEGKKQ
ncbi:hypothetical protein [Pseudodesulfovibrio sediminis]|uniref:Uncharacterized protein n=1 Tax=Pseudodesulfovibrio sediminis TaxID=2810563 RepID=A0ABM7P5I0_9BACT|nr:hypothetical protein [Pseudodesulfovibrio sediminis]BCS88098.1 hypothetical protein PSDVSF_13400 [Pseudodesulfovibrio sediminis]